MILFFLVYYLEHSAELVVNLHFQVKIASKFNLNVLIFQSFLGNMPTDPPR